MVESGKFIEWMNYITKFFLIDIYYYWNEGGYVYTPAVMINDLKYNGDLVASYVFEAI